MPTGGLFTSALAPQTLQAFAPDLAAQQTQLSRQQQMADILKQQGSTPLGNTEMVGGWAIKKNPLEGVAKMAQALSGGLMQNQIDDKQLALGKALQGRMGDILGGSTSQNRAATALSQGAAAQPSIPDESGEMVNQGGVGPTLENATRMDSIPQAAPNNFTMGNLIKGQLIGDLGGQAAGSAYWDQFKPTDGMKTDKYLGISADQSRASELAKRLKEGYIAPTSLRGQAYMTPDGKISTLPDAAQPGYMNKLDQATGEWSTAPVAGGLASVQDSTRASALGKTLGTLNQGVDDQNRPTYFLGLPPGAVGAPQGATSPVSAPTGQVGASPAPDATGQPGGPPPFDINHMSPQQSQALMKQAEAQFGLRPGAAPGTSVQGPAPGSAMLPSAPLASAPAGPGMIRPANAPGFNDYQQGLAKAASDRYSGLIKQAQASPSRVNVLDNILDLSKAGVATGPTAEWTNKVKGMASSLGMNDKWAGSVSDYQEMTKMMAQNASRAWQAAGGTGTDAQLNQATQGNVNAKMFPQAVQGMAKFAKAGELALQGMTNAMQAANITDPKSQQQFESTWRQNMDPRLFQMKLMDAPEAQTYVANLKKSDPAGYQSLIKKAQNLKQMGGL